MDNRKIDRCLRTRQFGRLRLLLDACTSTNDVARDLALAGAPEGYAIVSETQTEGRGRFGRAWLSPRGGIWLTAILRPPTLFSSLLSIPLIGALAVARGVNSTLGIRTKVRWPNDVVLDHRKLAGVSAEGMSRGNSLDFALLGIGVNANFSSSLLTGFNKSCTSLLDVIGRPVNRELLICSILLEFEQSYGLVLSGNTTRALDLLREHDCSAGSKVRVFLGDVQLVGTLTDLVSLTEVRIARKDCSSTVVDSGSADSVEYLAD